MATSLMAKNTFAILFYCLGIAIYKCRLLEHYMY